MHAVRYALWAGLVLSLAPAGAHEIGTTRVTVSLRRGSTYEAEIRTDAASLAAKLAAARGEPQPDSAGPDVLARYDKVFRTGVKLAFDGVGAHPAAEYLTAAGTTIIRLRGPIPQNARSFTWTCRWTFASYAITVRNEDSGHSRTEWLEGGQDSSPFGLSPPPAAGRLRTVRRYLVLGFTHIVPHGFDHMLFVLGIFLLSRRARDVLSQVSAFTAAHSITLGLSLYGIVSVPAAIVEPCIALSIAYVAIENIFQSALKPWRVALVFGFGLLHGLGFAGALRDTGLPAGEFLTALVTFNLGVEAGQLAVIATAFAALHRCAGRSWYRGRIVVPVSAAVACTAVYWTIERLL